MLIVRRASLLTDVRVKVPWGEIRGTVWGPDQGRPVLCLHGWADNCGSFSTLVPLLPPGELLQNIMETWKGIQLKRYQYNNTRSGQSCFSCYIDIFSIVV